MCKANLKEQFQGHSGFEIQIQLTVVQNLQSFLLLPLIFTTFNTASFAFVILLLETFPCSENFIKVRGQNRAKHTKFIKNVTLIVITTRSILKT